MRKDKESRNAPSPLQAKEDVKASQQPPQFKLDASPIQRFKVEDGDAAKYPKFSQFVSNEMPKSINDARLVKYLNQYGTNQGETARDVRSDLSPGQGPVIKPWSLAANSVSFQSNRGSELIRLSRQDISAYEKNNDYNQRFHEMVLESNIMNGYTHFLDDQDGKDVWGNEGKKVEEKSFGRDIESVFDAKRASHASFGEGEWQLSVEGMDAAKAHRMRIFHSESSNGLYDLTPGLTMSVKPLERAKWNLRLESHGGDTKDKKGWENVNLMKIREGADNYVIRGEDGADRDRNDVVIRVKKTAK